MENDPEIAAVPPEMPGIKFVSGFYVLGGRVYLQNVDSMPAYSPNGPSFFTICLTTSIGPLNVLVLSCSLDIHELTAIMRHTPQTYLIFTSSNGTTTKLSCGRGERVEYCAMLSKHTVAPAVHPVSTERD